MMRTIDDRCKSRWPRGAGVRASAVLAVLALPLTAPGLCAQEPSGAGGRPLSLEGARVEALEGNTDYRIAGARREMAEASAAGGAAVYWPRLDFESGFVRSNDPVFAFGTKLRQGSFGQADFDVEALNHPDPVTDWMNRVTLQWKIFSPTEWTAHDAAARQADAAAWAETRAREATLFRTEILYLEAQRTGARLRAAQHAEEAATANRDVFARRLEEGVLTRADLLQAEAEYSLAVARRVEAERLEEDARRSLGIFLGWDAEILPILTDTLGVREAEPAEFAALAGFAPEARADLQALASARSAASADRKRAGRAYMPEIAVIADYGIHAADAFHSDGDNWTVGVGLTWNLFSGFGRSNGKRRADAARIVAETRYQAALRGARAELAEATSAEQSARRAVEATAAADTAATAGSELMRRRFEEGMATATDVLQAEARRAQAESHAIDAQVGYRMAVARLRFVTTLHPSEIDR